MWIKIISSMVLLGVQSVAVMAEDFPIKSLRLVVPLAAGGAGDTMGRFVARGMSKVLNQNVIVENRSGADTIIGSEFVARSKPDGYTLLHGNSSLTFIPTLNKRSNEKINIDPVKELLPVSLITTYPYILIVHPNLPVKNVKEFVTLAKKYSTNILYGSAGKAALGNLAMELLLLKTNTKLTHIPYKDSAPLQIGLITGEIQCGFITLPDSISHLRSAKLRAIGVTSVKRNHILPNIPTLIESDIAGHVVSQWGGILVPNKTPDHIINILYKTIVQVTASSDFILMVSDKGSDLIGNTPIEFSKFFQDETEKWGKVIEHTSNKIE